MHKSREAIPCMHTSYYPISQINSFLWYDIWWYYIDYCLLTFLCSIGTYWFFSTDLLSKLCRPTFLPTLGDFLGYKNHLQLSNLVYNILTLSYIKFTFRHHSTITTRWGLTLDNLSSSPTGAREADPFDFRLLESSGRESFLLSARLMLSMKFRESFDEIGPGELVPNNSFVFRSRSFTKTSSRAVRVLSYKQSHTYRSFLYNQYVDNIFTSFNIMGILKSCNNLPQV